MAAKPDRMKLYLIAIVAIVSIVVIMTVFGGGEPIGFIDDDATNFGGDAGRIPSGSAEDGLGSSFACFDGEGRLFRSYTPCR